LQLWNGAASPDSIPVLDWHREILDERLKELEANPDAGDIWEAPIELNGATSVHSPRIPDPTTARD
jgi:Putative addiction module component